MTKAIGVNRNKTLNLPCAAEAIVEGYIYKWDGTTGYMTVTTGSTDKAFAIAAQSSMDWQLNTAKTLTAMDNWQFYPLGSQEIVLVASKNSTEWDPGALVYVSSTNGLADISGTVIVGHYLGPEMTTSAVGQLIRVVLDTASTETAGSA